MLKKLPLVTTLCVLVICTACSQARDHIAQSKQVFENYRVYSWYQARGKVKAGLSSQVFSGMIQTIEQELDAKGYSKRKPESGDFFVNYQIAKQDISDTKGVFSYSGFDTGFQWFNREGLLALAVDAGNDRVTIPTIPRGMALIDIIDAKTNKLVWRATVDKASSKGMTQQQRDASMRAAVADALRWLPSSR